LCIEARLILFIAAHKINTPIGQSLSHIQYLAITERNWSTPSLHLNKGLVKFSSVTTIGVVQANVGQKLAKCNILWVFLVSKNRDPQATFHLNDA
jgi:hypothetical protein